MSNVAPDIFANRLIGLPVTIAASATIATTAHRSAQARLSDSTAALAVAILNQFRHMLFGMVQVQAMRKRRLPPGSPIMRGLAGIFDQDQCARGIVAIAIQRHAAG